VQSLHPLRLKASLHETIWDGRRLERDGVQVHPDDRYARLYEQSKLGKTGFGISFYTTEKIYDNSCEARNLLH
jgi:hypothetical protein